MRDSSGRSHGFFEPFPTQGFWTVLGLTRGQLLGILMLACAVYVFLGGPLWSHLGEDDFRRIAVSYGVIPPAVALALFRNQRLRLALLLGGTAVLAALKLLMTAAAALLLDLVR